MVEPYANKVNQGYVTLEASKIELGNTKNNFSSWSGASTRMLAQILPRRLNNTQQILPRCPCSGLEGLVLERVFRVSGLASFQRKIVPGLGKELPLNSVKSDLVSHLPFPAFVF